MDGNRGISTDDYANLFLIPRHLCSAAITELHEHSTASCSIKPDECQAVTACPALETLTLVLWYDKLVIDSCFLHAMVHMASHHPRMKRLNLVSRRLRYEPRLLDNNVTLDEWFRFKVLPVLRLAEELFKQKLELYIYILTNDQHSYGTSMAIERHRASFPNIHVTTIRVLDFTPTDTFERAAAIHRQVCFKEIFDQAWKHQGLARLKALPDETFL